MAITGRRATGLEALAGCLLSGWLLSGLLLGGCGSDDEADDSAPGGTAGVGGSSTSGGSAGSAGSGGSAGAAGRGGTSGSGGAANTVDAGSVEDPAPDATEPGESRTCDAGALDSDLSVFVYTDITDTSINLRGTVTGAVGDGVYYVAEGAQAIGGPVATDATTGAFDITLPLFCGEQLVKLLWSNESCQLAVVSRVARVACSDEQIRVTLSWDGLGDDFELHLIRQDGRINDDATDCTWTSCVGAGPDWGVAGDASDDPVKDVDDTDTYGPENIYYSDPESGLYTIMVEHWASGSAEADGQVIINVAGSVYTNAIANLAPQRVWTVGTIEWPSGAVTLSQDVFDCSGNWSSGCQAELPE
jgi:hypothetical protein